MRKMMIGLVMAVFVTAESGYAQEKQDKIVAGPHLDTAAMAKAASEKAFAEKTKTPDGATRAFNAAKNRPYCDSRYDNEKGHTRCLQTGR